MALPLERFFMLAETVNERESERVKEQLSYAAFIAWLTAQDEWNTMYQGAVFQAQSTKQAKGIQERHKKWISEYPGFNDYLRKLGILRDN